MKNNLLSFDWLSLGIALLSMIVFWFVIESFSLLRFIPIVGNRPESVIYFLLIGALLGFTRIFWISAVLAGLGLSLWLTVCFTPLAGRMVSSLQVTTSSSQLYPDVAQAAVVLGSGIHANNTFNSVSEARFLGGLSVVRQEFAPRIVLTQSPPPDGSHIKAAQALMDRLKITYPMISVGPVRNTHDEALLVTELARERGWKTIIVVTSPTHSRRAQLVFSRAGREDGLKVLSVPCEETAYNPQHLTTPDQRLKAFSSALREIVGIIVYRQRGWI